jgi:hypothetical protein
MNVKNISILLLFLPFCGLAQSGIQLSPRSEVSIITCGPGQDELYSAFGHSAIRVYDPSQEVDLAFNYGVFDFNQPNFYLNFAKGYLYYKLGVHDYQAFEYHYIMENRYVHEQILNLTLAQKQKLLDYLSWNSLPENEHYRYDYFYDNCATKMPGVVTKVFGDSIHFDGSYIKTDYTIRELTDLYLRDQPWGDLGIDICLGLPMDKVATPYQYMFLPDYVESGFAHATISRDGRNEPLVKRRIVKHDPAMAPTSGGLIHPLLVFSFFALVVVALSVVDLRKRSISVWLDLTLFSIVGAVGLLLFCLWFFTDHAAAAKNLNLLWALPSHLVVIFFLRKNPSWLKHYFGITAAICVVLLLFWWTLPQKLHYSLVPLVIAIATRALVNLRVRSIRVDA